MDTKKELAKRMSNMEKTASEMKADFLSLGAILDRYAEFLKEEPISPSDGEKCAPQTQSADFSVKTLRK
ncbi:MAG: hypothetical protein SFW07_05710 [Gammaproteobacteria bacterium]|nr:hypothetical protein [Gammaproteobacteria bacterium]